MINGGVYGGCSAQHGGGRGTRLLLVHHRLGGGHRQGRSLQYPLLKKSYGIENTHQTMGEYVIFTGKETYL